MAGKPKRDAPPTQARKGSACIHRTCKLITLILSIYIQNTKLKLDIFFKRKKDEREGSKGKHQRVPHFLHQQKWDQGFPGGSDGKESACNAGDLGSIPGLGRSPGEGNGNPLQYSCLESPMTEEPGGLPSTASQRVRHSGATNTFTSLPSEAGPENGDVSQWLCPK